MAGEVAFTPIGLARTPFADRVSTPRQPAAARGARGTIELFPGHDFEHALEDLEGWDRIWVVFCFHLNASAGWRPKVLPPRSAGKRRGVFSTRSPHRPNPIGLSVLRLEAVRGLVLHVLDVDLVDGTPVLDIKPYVPYADAFPGARTGWLGPLAPVDIGGDPRTPATGVDIGGDPRTPATGVDIGGDPRTPATGVDIGGDPRTPATGVDIGGDPRTPATGVELEGESRAAAVDPEPGFAVGWAPLAAEQAAWLRREHGIDLEGPVTRVLELGPQPHPYRRIKAEGDGFRLALKDWRVRFRVLGRTVTVEAIRSGYRPAQLAAPATPEEAVQRAFVERFPG